MAKIRMLMMLVLVLLVGSACTYNRALREQFYRPTSSGAEKLPLKVGLLVNQNEQSGMIKSNKDIIRYDIEVNPGMANAVAAELATIFQDVVIVKEPKQAAGVGLLATMNFDISENQAHTFTARLELALRDPQTKFTLANFQQSEGVNVGMSAGAFVGAFLTGFTLFAGAPIFMPMAAHFQGEKAVEVFEEKLPQLVRKVVSEIGSDQRVVAFASGMRPAPFGGMMPPMAAGPPPKAPAVASDVDKVPEGKPVVRKNAYAVVVGVEQYRQKLPKADYAAHDAQVMSEYLTKVMGFQEENVVLIVDDHAGRTDLEKYVEKWLPNRVEKGDTVFIYFSGHGAPNPKTGEAYLVPYDGDPSYIDTTGYPLKRLYEQLAALPARKWW